jgi:antirestriction protein ArdC
VRDSRAKSAFLHITSTSRLLKIMKGDRKAIFTAASAANKAAEYLLSRGGA